MKRLLLTTLLFLLAPATAHAAALTPALKVDSFFGVLRDDLGSDYSINEGAAGIATHDGRIYTVGWTTVSGDISVYVIARRANGAYDTGFSSDGKLLMPIGAAGKTDYGRGITVLPDGRLRVVGEVDVSSGGTSNLEPFIAGLMPDGSMDPSFGDGGDGIEILPSGTGDDAVSRIAVDATGRLAVAGYTKTGAFKDTLVSLRQPDGSPVPSFGTNGVRIISRSDNGWNDDAADVVFRSAGGLAVLIRSCVDANDTGCAAVPVIRALREDGNEDPAFGAGGEISVPSPGQSLTPTALIEHRGRLWMSATANMTAADGDGFIARVEADGSGLQTRRFDIRGTYTGSDMIDTSSGDLVVLAGPPETLVVVGDSQIAQGTNYFAAAAFYGFDADLAAAPQGDVVLEAQNALSLNGVAADGSNAVAASGLTLNQSAIDLGLATTRILLDADKKCDLAIDVPTPLELTFIGRKGTAAQISVENKGERPCGGEVTVAAPYKLGRAVSTGVIEPGAKFVTSNVPVTSSTIRRDDDVAKFSISVPGDGDTSNDVRGVRAVYSFCDLALSAVEKPSTIPNEGGRRVEVGVRNSGTRTCRSVKFSVPNGAGEGASKPYAIERGRAVSDDVWVSSKSTAKVGKTATVTVKSASADEDVVAKNDSIRLTARVVGVGDTRVRATSATRVSGSATGGKGTKADRSGIRLARVEVAIRKLGSGCRWLSCKKFTNRKTDACTPSGWQTASGKGSWSLRLTKLPAGRYEVYTRAVTANAFREGRFSTKDGNRRAFRVR